MNKKEIRQYFKDQDLNTGADVFEKLNHEELEILKKAGARAKANKRRTVLGKDL